ncbi:MAG: type II secretion system F family protein [bacterium]|nr:type II secretion system F family protein [bacterium]
MASKSSPLSFSFGVGKEKEYFIENFVMLLESGMDLIASLDAIHTELKTPRMREILTDMKEGISAGEPIYAVLERSNLFRPYVISLIRVGEKSGKLFQNLNAIALQQKKDRVFTSKLRSALMYPVFIFSITFIIGIGVAWFILPNLANVFASLKLELPITTKILIATGTFLGKHGVVAVPALIAGLGFLGYGVFGYSKTKFIGQYLLLNFPGLGRVIHDIELARIGYIMGSLLQAGLPIVDTLESLRNTTTFSSYRKFYSYLKDQIEEGNTFHKSFQTYSGTKTIISGPIQQMIVAGEQSGRLPETFIKIGELYEEKTESTSKDLAVVLEPVLLLMVWVGVVGVALAVIMPLYSLIGGLNR